VSVDSNACVELEQAPLPKTRTQNLRKARTSKDKTTTKKKAGKGKRKLNSNKQEVEYSPQFINREDLFK
jgi:hypothetical protein